MLTEACVQSGDVDYESGIENAFGTIGKVALGCAMIFLTYGANLSFFIIIGSTLSTLTTSWGCTSNVCNQYYMTIIPVIVVVFPINLLRQYSNTSWVAVFSIVTVCAITLLVVSQFCLFSVHDETSHH